ncbi:ParB N-terminal domain-containing protein [Crenobacter caeni]|uniref:ParB N-terminal domain-containing protein n=1 Tax=Crenobacter caeni TaxID=2705474 RepID=A0A6B2KTX8_9NEIS|nr:ParB N-terminal domain-containing protein [Crenobacter caeni]NDV13427.1 ParB N-terminal domain-containing protein [Crenobacter caeni]
MSSKVKKGGKHNIKSVRIDEIDAHISNQIRNPDALKWNEKHTRPADEERHIEELLKELKTSDKATRFKKPLQVVINDQNPQKPYVLTDGFHRYEAYKRHTKRSDYKVPVVVIEGGLEKARLIAHQNNTEPKLGMTKSETVQSAWERIAEGAVDGLSLREAALELRISKSQVSKMRDVLKQIREGDLLGEPQPDYGKDGDHLLWRKEVKKLLRGGEDFELPEEKHPVADALLKKWREQIIEHAQNGEPEWFLKQADRALHMALEEILEDDDMRLRTVVDAVIEESDF